MSKQPTMTVEVRVGKTLLGKARVEVRNNSETEVTGVLCGIEEFAAPIATIALLYAAHMFAPTGAVQSAISAVVALVSPGDTVKEDQSFVVQHPLLSPSDGDLPF